MVSHNNPDEYRDDFWANNFAPDESPKPDDEEQQYQLFIPVTAAQVQGVASLSGTFPYGEHQSDISGASSPPLLQASDYDLHFGLSLPQAPPPLFFEDLINEQACYEGAPPQGPNAPTPEQSGSSQAIGSGPVPIPTSFPNLVHNVSLGGPLMSASFPGNLHSSQTPIFPDAHRTRSSSYAGPNQTPYHHAMPPLAYHTPPNLGFSGTFQVAFEEIARASPTVMSPPTGPTQYIISFDSNGHEHDHLSLPPTTQPSSIPLPASPSEESSYASSPTLSPATSTSSLASPPSPSTSRTETFRWRLNAHDDQGWRCECVHQAKKKKRHLESCPSNPNKPWTECKLCPQRFIGGSRMSALSKHMSNIHGRKSNGSGRSDGKKKDKRR